MSQPLLPPVMDAVAALRCWAVEAWLTIDGQEHMFRIEAAPAADWLIATLQSGHLSYLPGMLDDSQRDRILEALGDGSLTPAELQEANRDVLEQASGWPWWQAGRLIGTLGHHWATLGAMVLASGADPWKHPLGAVLGTLYSVMVQNTPKKEDREALINQITAPPVVDMADGEWDEDAAEKAVWAMLAAKGHAPV